MRKNGPWGGRGATICPGTSYSRKRKLTNEGGGWCVIMEAHGKWSLIKHHGRGVGGTLPLGSELHLRLDLGKCVDVGVGLVGVEVGCGGGNTSVLYPPVSHSDLLSLRSGPPAE